MAESIDFEVNSNIGDAAKDVDKFTGSVEGAQKAVDDLNENFKIQANVISGLENELEGLEKKMLDTPKSAMGWSSLNKVIKETELELKNEKLALKELNQEMKDAEGNLSTATQEQKKLNKGLEDGGKAAGDAEGGVKSLGSALKGLGIVAVLAAAFTALKEALGRNQKVMDTVNTVMTTISTTFNQVVDVLIDTVEWVTESSDRFDGLTKVLSGMITIAITPLKLSFYAIKLGIEQARLAWEKSFLGSGDPGTIRELTAGIIETKQAIADVAAEAVQAGADVINNFGDAIGEIGAIGEMAIAGLSEISVKANYAAAEAQTAASNSALLAAAQIQGLIEKYDRQAELQRQIRDDVSQDMADRIKANEELGRILDEQSEAMLRQQDIKIAAAQLELQANSDNIEMQVALTEAINERAAIEAQITGLKSEQLVNLVALQQEQQALDDEAFAKKVEEEELLFNLQNENLLASITNLQERALKELEINQAADIAAVQGHENREKLIAEINKKYDGKKAKLAAVAIKADQKMAKMNTQAKIDIAQQAFSGIAAIMGKESKAGKAAAAASATVSALQGATSAFASLAPIPFVGPVLGGIAAAAALIAGYKNVKEIYATKSPELPGSDVSGGGGGGGGAAPEVPDLAAAAGAAEDEGVIAPQMVGGAFELGGGEEPGATQAYVVTDDMTDSQEQLAGIRRRASV
tara:strand:+ start:4973 stop:7060 length:2088 start_codon:yes stop_codon:yes gene_type:complete